VRGHDVVRAVDSRKRGRCFVEGQSVDEVAESGGLWLRGVVGGMTRYVAVGVGRNMMRRCDREYLRGACRRSRGAIVHNVRIPRARGLQRFGR
jgi:hypothetical protein